MGQFPEIEKPDINVVLAYEVWTRSMSIDESEPTHRAQPIFIYVKRQTRAEETEEESSVTANAEVELHYREASARARMSERHTPQLLDSLVFISGGVGFVAGPMFTTIWAPESMPAGVLFLICLLEMIGLLAGMAVYRLRRKEK
ncbi:MAG TPA: hypothetical protein VLJ59_01715 [Mycobacteriales bacterium]|nr:hypothetical protein [Mycobacteriales bacterium]